MERHSNNNLAEFLRQMISIPSYSFQEERRAEFICETLTSLDIPFTRVKNNIIATSITDEKKYPTLMLNSHIDTVHESASYSFDPFHPQISDTTVWGLGSNDAGGCVVSMIETFRHFYGREIPLNLILVLTAEEERSGANGIDLLVSQLNHIADYAIIGEPTAMRAAIAERGLIVVDAEAHGVSGHAARKDGINAIDIAIADIQALKSYDWMTVTQISAGTQHNVIPDSCKYVIDIRTSAGQNNQEIFDHLKEILHSQLTARSLSNRSSMTPEGCILLDVVDECGVDKFISPTTSDWMRIDIPAIKMGPGESTRSHKADEYITIEELEKGVDGYIKFIDKFCDIIKKQNGK